MQLRENFAEIIKHGLGDKLNNIIYRYPWFLKILNFLNIETTDTFKDKLRNQLITKFAQIRPRNFEDKQNFVAFFIYLICKEIREKGFDSVKEIYESIEDEETEEILTLIVSNKEEIEIDDLKNPDNLHLLNDTETLYNLAKSFMG